MVKVLCNVTTCRHNSKATGRNRRPHCTKPTIHIDDTLDPTAPNCTDIQFNRPYEGMPNTINKDPKKG